MTDLDKIVRRRSRLPFAHYRRRLVVMLEPGDVIAMRMERTRTVHRGALAAVFRQLVEWHAAARQRERRVAKRHRRPA